MREGVGAPEKTRREETTQKVGVWEGETRLAQTLLTMTMAMMAMVTMMMMMMMMMMMLMTMIMVVVMMNAIGAKKKHALNRRSHGAMMMMMTVVMMMMMTAVMMMMTVVMVTVKDGVCVYVYRVVFLEDIQRGLGGLHRRKGGHTWSA
jgi:hypothetical protein